MPRKVEPRWEWDGGSKRPRVTLAADQRARIRDSIGLTEAQIEEIAPDVALSRSLLNFAKQASLGFESRPRS